MMTQMHLQGDNGDLNKYRKQNGKKLTDLDAPATAAAENLKGRGLCKS